jgi:hypothetical protein
MIPSPSQVWSLFSSLFRTPEPTPQLGVVRVTPDEAAAVPADRREIVSPADPSDVAGDLQRRVGGRTTTPTVIVASTPGPTPEPITPTPDPKTPPKRPTPPPLIPDSPFRLDPGRDPSITDVDQFGELEITRAEAERFGLDVPEVKEVEEEELDPYQIYRGQLITATARVLDREPKEVAEDIVFVPKEFVEPARPRGVVEKFQTGLEKIGQFPTPIPGVDVKSFFFGPELPEGVRFIAEPTPIGLSPASAAAVWGTARVAFTGVAQQIAGRQITTDLAFLVRYPFFPLGVTRKGVATAETFIIGQTARRAVFIETGVAGMVRRAVRFPTATEIIRRGRVMGSAGMGEVITGATGKMAIATTFGRIAPNLIRKPGRTVPFIAADLVKKVGPRDVLTRGLLYTEKISPTTAIKTAGLIRETTRIPTRIFTPFPADVRGVAPLIPRLISTKPITTPLQGLDPGRAAGILGAARLVQPYVRGLPTPRIITTTALTGRITPLLGLPTLLRPAEQITPTLARPPLLATPKQIVVDTDQQDVIVSGRFGRRLRETVVPRVVPAVATIVVPRVTPAAAVRQVPRLATPTTFLRPFAPRIFVPFRGPPVGPIPRPLFAEIEMDRMFKRAMRERPYKRTPSLIALALDIEAPKPVPLEETGLVARPVIGRGRRRKPDIDFLLGGL